jgi:hypothetical protein
MATTALLRLTLLTLLLICAATVSAIAAGRASPNGVIAYTHVAWTPTDYSVHVLDVWRGQVFALDADPEQHASLPLWSADGGALYYECSASSLALEVCCVSLGGVCSPPFPSLHERIFAESSVSPDGVWTIYSDSDSDRRYLQLFLYNSRTGQRWQITHAPADHRHPAWKP